ncbi:hypothetical protein BJ944DRAFT_90911 [Cunninghamella echinulata]|nr:hypothetical protein BJ944DRAFT_90911 [Cunninghamella echinulata]
MPPKQIIETTAASIINLKAQLALEKEQFDRERHGSQKKKPATKKTDWIKQNKGVEQRAKRDRENGVINPEEQDAILKSQEALKRKAKLYESYQQQIQPSDEDFSDDENMLIDFTQKYMQEDKLKDKGKKKNVYANEKEKEELSDDDPWVEYLDEFGRTRVVRQSQLPSSSAPPSPTSSISPPLSPKHATTIHPSYLGLADRSHIRHYTNVKEIRTKGVGHYSFAADDEEERQRQMDELNRIRKETELARKQSRSASERRRAILAKRAEWIHQKRAILRRKKQQQANDNNNNDNYPVVNEDSITSLLTSLRQQVRK